MSDQQGSPKNYREVVTGNSHALQEGLWIGEEMQ